MYVFGSGGRLKFGVSRAPEARAHGIALQGGIPVEVVAVRWFPTRAAALRVEARLHSQYRAHRIAGEWFASDGCEGWQAEVAPA